MPAAARHTGPDLFTLAALAEAEALCVAAEAARALAARRYRLAAQGERETRRQALRQAAHAALAADIALQRARREVGA